MNLLLIDKENYILDGVLFSIPNKNIPISNESVIKTVARYKENAVDKGNAFGLLDKQISSDVTDEVDEQVILDMRKQDPTLLIMALDQPAADSEREVIAEEEAAFQILDILYDQENKKIMGRIHLLDTHEGRLARKKIDEGNICYISKGIVEEAIDPDRTITNRISLIQKIIEIKGGWRLLFIKR